jgi:hypothetical protein
MSAAFFLKSPPPHSSNTLTSLTQFCFPFRGVGPLCRFTVMGGTKFTVPGKEWECASHYVQFILAKGNLKGVSWARICKRWWRPGIDSEESTPAAYVHSMAGRYDNRVVLPACPAGSRFLGFLKGLQIWPLGLAERIGPLSSTPSTIDISPRLASDNFSLVLTTPAQKIVKISANFCKNLKWPPWDTQGPGKTVSWKKL